MYQSETSKHRDKLAQFCTGMGIDIGFGGDPIQPNAIRIDFPTPYACTGDYGVQLAGDARDLSWFKDGVLDYVYSSHLLEDFEEKETELTLREWTRVLKKNGRLILLLPDQQKYLAYCKKTKQGTNEHHSIDHFSLQYVKDKAAQLGNLAVVKEAEGIDDYSFFVIFEKTDEASLSLNQVSLEGQLFLVLKEKDRLKEELRVTKQHLEKYQKNYVIKTLKAVYHFFK